MTDHLQLATKARWAVTVLFWINGLFVGAWAANIPLVKAGLGIGTGGFGLALLCSALGAIVAMPFTGYWVGRYGSAFVLRWVTPTFCLFFLIPVTFNSVPVIILGLIGFGAAMGSMDVAMNSHGIAVEKQLARPVMSSFHGMFSLGAAMGAGLAILLISHLGAMPFNLLVDAFALALFFFAQSQLLPATVDQGVVRNPFAMPTWSSLGLGLLCCLALMSEGAVIDWVGLELQGSFHMDATRAGVGFFSFAGGMMLSRFVGDRLRSRFGSEDLVRGSAALAGLGLGLALLLTSFKMVIFSYFLAGLGIGNLAPVLFAGGGRSDKASPARGIAAVTTLGYAGFIMGPPLLGFVAEFTTLKAALGLVVVAMLATFAGAKAARSADG